MSKFKAGGLGRMLVPTIILGVIAITVTLLVYFKGTGDITDGMKGAGITVLQMLPLLIFAMIIATMLQKLIDPVVISRWLGSESGLRGIMIGSVLGGLMPGGPFTAMPIAVGFMRLGAGVGTMVAFMTGWSLIAIARMPLEIGIMGWKFTLIRLACTFFMAPIAGWLAARFFSNVSLYD
jgi:uncharacterized protein